jgi:mono/diheme cytochrome c family protein
VTRFVLTLALLTGTVACRGGISEDPPIVPIRGMYNQSRYDAQEKSEFFQDQRTMRPPVPGTVAREMPVNPALESGRTDDDTQWLLEVPGDVIRDFHPTIADEDYERTSRQPMQPTRTWTQLTPEEQGEARQAMAERGHQRFDIYCAPCHGYDGVGRGMVTQRAQLLSNNGTDPGAAQLLPPSFHDATYRNMPDGQIYATITHGVRNMPAYAQSIPLADRWAIVSYVRALQLSQASRRTASADAQRGPR